MRHVARVVMLDKSGCVLLCRYVDHAQPRSYWVPPGGALEPGEDHRTAAIREVREETGLDIRPQRELWQRQFHLTIRGEPVEQLERYFLARIETDRPPVANASPEDIEELRWWSLEELRATRETIYPDGLVDSLTRLLS